MAPEFRTGGSIEENGPSIEQVGEFSVVANAFNAEYGGYGSWFTNVTIRSGTNLLHGSVYDHFGNDKFDARSFFQAKRASGQNMYFNANWI